MGQRGRPRHPELLTPREQDVLALIREGLTNDQIAARLGISFDTAKAHVSAILSKLGVATRDEAAAWRRERRTPAVVKRLLWSVPLAASLALLAGVALLAWGVSRGSTADEPAGRIVFSSAMNGNYDLWVTNADGNGLRQLTHVDQGRAIVNPQWSPDGRRIYFLGTDYDPHPVNPDPHAVPGSDVYAINADGSELSQITSTAEAEECLVVSDKGNLFYDRGALLFEASADGSGEREVGRAVCPLDISPDETQALYENQGLSLNNVDGRSEIKVTTHLTAAQGAAWWPTGHGLASLCTDELVNPPPRDICITYRGQVTRLAPPVLDLAGDPSWSPDGQWLLIPAERSLEIVRSDGSDSRTLLECQCLTPDWGP